MFAPLSMHPTVHTVIKREEICPDFSVCCLFLVFFWLQTWDHHSWTLQNDTRKRKILIFYNSSSTVNIFKRSFRFLYFFRCHICLILNGEAAKRFILSRPLCFLVVRLNPNCRGTLAPKIQLHRVLNNDLILLFLNHSNMVHILQ